MDTDMLWINEGFMYDDAGDVVMTSYVDLREPGSRTPIRTLVKGCKREHALEDSKTIQASAFDVFRKEGKNLIRDSQEGLAKEESETVLPETPEEALELRGIEDLKDAFELADPDVKIRVDVTHRSVEGSSGSLEFGKEWWIVSTAIAPETEEELAAWREQLDPDYDHESVIGQPAKFAEALARMVAEQLGPQRDGISMKSGIGDSPEAHSQHRGQWVIHGPVVYAASVYEALSQKEDEASRIAALMFTKSASHAALREYRFVILRAPSAAKQVRLQISGMMRDALEPTEHGLQREAPADGETEVKAAEPKRGRQWSEARPTRATTTEKVAKRKAREVVTKGAGGSILSSESGEQEEVREKTVTHEFKPEDEAPAASVVPGLEKSRRETRQIERQGDESAEDEPVRDDAAAVKEFAIEHAAAATEAASEGDGLAVEGGAGQILRWLEADLEDPAYPTPATSWPSVEEALGPEEVHRLYGFVTTLGHKVTLVPPEHRQEAASACWHAIQCIRNVFVKLGDIVATVSIERGRFVVLELKESEEVQAKGRIVLASSGAYAYCVKHGARKQYEGSQGSLGMVFFPMGSQLEDWDSLGWRLKEKAGGGVPDGPEGEGLCVPEGVPGTP